MNLRAIICLMLFFALGACQPTGEANDKTAETAGEKESVKPAYAIVIHGGAGTITRSMMTAEMEAEYRATLNAALDIGEGVLAQGGSALDAVEQTIRSLEDSPLFNAGKGAVFTHEGKNELDAAIMMGSNLAAGSIGGVTTVRNPISLARAVMEKSPHVMMAGPGAEEFAKEQGLEIVSPDYFFTQKRFDALQKAIQEEKEKQPMGYTGENRDYKFGTVGCVALDKAGHIVAGTSTGGMTNKRYNRIGDAPIIGAGTYANDATCGISCTGHGEFFIRYTVAHDVSALMEYQGLSLQEAADKVVMDKLVKAGGEGGLVALDRQGNIAMPFNSEGMYRGYARPGERVVEIYKDEKN
ncbi:MAG: isoaspartyl peptidase/L-asparaginase [Lewinellaceae bacterium]|nr:isoaspartyl peptidase/L-asparaginase [Lewinellaceae bacterium]